jgi:O-antigen ligase
LFPALALVAIGAASVLIWNRPWAGLGFLVAGAIPYYASLHVLGVETSGTLTGAIIGGSGCISLARLLLRQRRWANPVVIVLFVVFVAIWYLRWYQEPPQLNVTAETADFAERSRVFMIAFAVVPFLGGLLARGEADYRSALSWLAIWGCLGVVIVGLYWALDQPNLSAEGSGRWEPIPSLTGIILSFDMGTGCLALLALCNSKKGRQWHVVRWLAIGIIALLSVRVGQRGPFIFFAIAVMLNFLIIGSRHVLRSSALIAVAATIIYVVASDVSENYGATRAFDSSNYTAGSNEDRLFLWSKALEFAMERPLFGWGGSLVGLWVGDVRWMYSHATLLDPLVETGLLGTVPCWAMFILILQSLGRRWRVPISGQTVGSLIVPFVVYAILESQVMGHVSMSKHMWFALGLSASLGHAGFPAVRSRLAPTRPGRIWLSNGGWRAARKYGETKVATLD